MDKKIIAPEKANFLEIANRHSPEMKITKLQDITIEHYIITAFGEGSYEKGEKTVTNTNTGMLAHLDEYASRLAYDGNDVDNMKDVIKNLSVEDFFNNHLVPFSDFVKEKDYSGYKNKFKQLRMVGTRYNISHNVVPIQNLKDLESGAKVVKNPKSTPFIEPQSSKYPDKMMTVENLDLALRKIQNEIDLAEQKIETRIDPETGKKLTVQQTDALRTRVDMLHAGRAGLVYQLHTGLRGGEAFSLYTFDHQADEAFNVTTKKREKITNPARAIDNTQFSTFQKKVEGNQTRFFIDIPETITKIPDVDFSVELDPRIGAILDAQAERIQKMVLNGKTSRSIFAHGVYKNGVLTEVIDAFDYTKLKPKTAKGVTKTTVDVPTAFNTKLKDFLFGEKGLLAISGISWNENIEIDDPVTGQTIKGASQSYFNDHDIRGTLITYANTHKSRIKDLINSANPNNPVDESQVIRFIDYATGRDALNDINKKHYYRPPSGTPMERWVDFSVALNTLMLEDSQELQKLTVNSLDKIGYDPNKTGKEKTIQKQVSYKEANNVQGSITGEQIQKTDIVQPVINEDPRLDLTVKERKEYDRILSTDGPDKAKEFYDGKMGGGTLSFGGVGAIQDQMGEIANQFKTGKTAAAIGKSLPFIGPVVGTALGIYYYSKPLDDYKITGTETEDDLRKIRFTRALAEPLSGINPIPEPAVLNLLNLAPGEQNLNIMSAAEAVAPTRAEVEEREKSGSLIFGSDKENVVGEDQQQKEVIEPQTNGNDIYSQMHSLMRSRLLDTDPQTS